MTEKTLQSAADSSEAEKSGVAQQKDAIGEIVRTLFWALLVALGIRVVAYEPFNIPSASMLPTLLVGDYLFVSKYAYGYSRHSLPFSLPLFGGRIFEGEVERGDVIVFKTPRDNKTDFIKRAIGLPGDRIQVIGGVLHINGEPVRRERVDDFVFTETPNTECRSSPSYRSLQSDGSIVCRLPQFRETLPNGISFMTIDLRDGDIGDDTKEYVVPQGYYFMMGDNRDNSMDSRRSIARGGVGFVPAQNLVGRAEIVFFSTDGTAPLWAFWNWISAARGSRFFDSLRPDD